MNKLKLFLVIIFLIFSLIIIIFQDKPKVCFDKKCFEVTIVKTEEDRQKGLIGVNYLEKDKGMFFVFPNEQNYGFWMKNMLIQLDIIWFNKNKEVIYFEKNVSPCDELCETYYPYEKALFVLEINAGQIEELGIKVKDKVTLPSNYQLDFEFS